MTDDFAALDALATYHEACRLAREGHEGVRRWFAGYAVKTNSIQQGQINGTEDVWRGGCHVTRTEPDQEDCG